MQVKKSTNAYLTVSNSLNTGMPKELEYAEGTPWKAFSTIITDKNLV